MVTARSRLSISKVLVSILYILIIISILINSAFAITDSCTADGHYYKYEGSYNLFAPHKVNLYHTDAAKVAELKKVIWQELASWGMTPEGIAGVMGNWGCESHWDPTRTQSNLPWDQFGLGRVGIGLEQWTYPTRQIALFNKAASMGKQWTDLSVQFAVARDEFGPERYKKEGYATVLYESGHSIEETSDFILENVERPAVYNYDKRHKESYNCYNELSGLEPLEYNGESFSADADGTTNDGSNSQSEGVEFRLFEYEWELPGMPNNVKFDVILLNLATRQFLDSQQLYNLQSIRDDIVLRQGASVVDIIRIAVVAIGLCLVTLSVLMFGAIIFDKSNTIFEFSAVEILSLGYIIHIPDSNETAGVHSNTRRLIIMFTLVLLMGLFIASGGVLKFTSGFVSLVYKLFGTMLI